MFFNPHSAYPDDQLDEKPSQGFLEEKKEKNPLHNNARTPGKLAAEENKTLLRVLYLELRHSNGESGLSALTCLSSSRIFGFRLLHIT